MNSATEFRVFGPPGTGKTTYLVDQILKAGEKYGFGKLFVASFTRTAAREVSSRAVAKLREQRGESCDEPNFGTLHSHGYRAIGGAPKVAENMLKHWNEDHPEYSMTGGKNADIDEVQEYSAPVTVGDELYNEMNMNRALMIPKEYWRTTVAAFHAKWESWKAANGIVDYTDMLEIPLHDCERAPSNPSVGMLDEAQDASPLQMALFRKWGAAMDFIVLSGDPDQTIFSWAGARPEVMVEGEYAGKRVLSQSYRVPKAVYELAMDTIRSVRVREDAEYHPRDYDGEVRTLRGVSLATPEQILFDMEKYLAAGKRCMILASCSYMLDPLIKALRAAGLPFHNPWRTKAGAWNPLRGGESDARGTSSIQRLLAFREHVPFIDSDTIDARRFLSWYEVLRTTGNIPRGRRSAFIAELEKLANAPAGERTFMPANVFDEDQEGMIEITPMAVTAFPACDMFDLFDPACKVLEYFNGREAVEAEAVKWFRENVVNAKQKALEYPSEVLLRRGVEALTSEPQIVIGTIHSVKGGEADVVYVAPDLSYAGFVSMNSTTENKDAITRLKYVAYTRARETLVLLEGANKFLM